MGVSFVLIFNNYELRVQLGTGSWVNYRYRVFILPFNGRLPSVSETLEHSGLQRGAHAVYPQVNHLTHVELLCCPSSAPGVDEFDRRAKPS